MTVIPLKNRDPHEGDRDASGIQEEAADQPPTRGHAPARDETTNATRVPTTHQGRDRVAGLLELVRPPELWSEPRPSLQQVWNYAAYGPWTDQSRTTPARVAGMTYAAFAVALTFVGYSLLWVVERPARAAVAGVLAGLACLSWLI